MKKIPKMKKPSSLSVANKHDIPDGLLEAADRFSNEAMDLLMPLIVRYTGSIAINAIAQVHARVIAVVIGDDPDMLRQMIAFSSISLGKQMNDIIQVFKDIREEKV